MDNVVFRPLRSADQAVVAAFVVALYEEDPDGHPPDAAQITRTFDHLTAHPDYGTVFVFEREGVLVGYAILINFWSNEYGGLILNVDELFVAPAFRGQGLATRFLQYLIEGRFRDCVALELEVLPYNARALALYERLGFRKSSRSYLMYRR